MCQEEALPRKPTSLTIQGAMTAMMTLPGTPYPLGEGTTMFKSFSGT